MDANSNLRFICEEITSTLRYAESKHAVFMAFNGVAVFGGMGLLRTLVTNDSDMAIRFILLGTMFLLMCAMVASMLSFLPQILNTEQQPEQSCKNNLLFFEDVKTHTIETYVQTLCMHYTMRPEHIGEFERCLIGQIIANARLSSRKFRLFKVAIVFDMAAVIVGLGGLLTYNLLI